MSKKKIIFLCFFICLSDGLCTKSHVYKQEMVDEFQKFIKPFKNKMKVYRLPDGSHIIDPPRSADNENSEMLVDAGSMYYCPSSANTSCYLVERQYVSVSSGKISIKCGVSSNEQFNAELVSAERAKNLVEQAKFFPAPIEWEMGSVYRLSNPDEVVLMKRHKFRNPNSFLKPLSKSCTECNPNLIYRGSPGALELDSAGQFQQSLGLKMSIVTSAGTIDLATKKFSRNTPAGGTSINGSQQERSVTLVPIRTENEKKALEELIGTEQYNEIYDERSPSFSDPCMIKSKIQNHDSIPSINSRGLDGHT